MEADFQPAGEGSILPPGWEAGLTGSQGWLPPRFMAGEQVRMEQAAFHDAHRSVGVPPASFPSVSLDQRFFSDSATSPSDRDNFDGANVSQRREKTQNTRSPPGPASG